MLNSTRGFRGLYTHPFCKVIIRALYALISRWENQRARARQNARARKRICARLFLRPTGLPLDFFRYTLRDRCALCLCCSLGVLRDDVARARDERVFRCIYVMWGYTIREGGSAKKSGHGGDKGTAAFTGRCNRGILWIHSLVFLLFSGYTRQCCYSPGRCFRIWEIVLSHFLLVHVISRWFLIPVFYSTTLILQSNYSPMIVCRRRYFYVVKVRQGSSGSSQCG